MSIKSFIPAKLNLPMLWFTDVTLPVLNKFLYNLDTIDVTDSDKKTLKSLQKERLVYISNHPTTEEPGVAYHSANIMGSRFHYMAAREVFEWGAGLIGDFIQSIGAFSVLAGVPDRESLKASRDLLASPGGKLVLFPEGEPTSGMNDTLLPFQPGVAQLTFWSYEDALKKDEDAKLFLLPTFIKYRMTNSIQWMQKDIDQSLTKMESKLGISKTGKDIVHRFLSVGKRMIEREEKEFGISVEPEKAEDFDYRIGRMRHVILDNIANKTKIQNWDESANAIEKLRKILSFLEMVSVGIPGPNGEVLSMELATWAKRAASKAYDFITIQTNYIKELPSAERLYEFLYRYENELFGETKKRPHKAIVRLGAPFQIGDFYPQYKQDKKKAVDTVTNHLRQNMETLLNDELQKSNPLFPSQYIFA
ncbi:1-acyl-sn-glycerol-3-phosphate acyltransferase [Leptospira sp. 96542]|nr:1-acyl-sn-glycerol-3-phosphate acyltransferase [Leptospira sp. 96542]